MKKLNQLKLIILCILLSINFQSMAQETPQLDDDLYSMSLEDLMNIEINVASKNKSSLRESPGIISVITQEQIQKMGARDLIDILRLVPGFQFGTDVQGIVGAGIRGNWAHEGKMSLQIDGLEMNEILFSTTQFGHHFPVDNIKRIEIIRGPGSALYGGYAELGVVNIITRNADDIEGVAFGTAFSEMEKTFNQRNMTLSIGQKMNDVDVNLHTYMGTANRSDKIYEGINGDYSGFEQYEMKDHSELNTLHINMSVNKGEFKNRLIYDQYDVQNRDAFDAISPVFTHRYQSLVFGSAYTHKINDKLSLTPEFIYKKQSPYNLTNELSKDYGLFLNVVAQRITGRISANYELSEKINIAAGTEIFNDKGSAIDTTDYFITNSSLLQSSVSYFTYAAFAQASYKTEFVDLLGGIRAEENSAFGSAIVPRIALTKAFEKLHYKILISQAFRAPGISNIEKNRGATLAGINGITEIETEKTTVFEMELGYKITKNLFITANIFDITINKPIVYFYDEPTGEEGYQNYDQSGTRGFEADVKYTGKWGSVNATYSHYMQADKNKVETYMVPETFDDQALVGFARDKATLYATFNVWKGLSISPWVVYTGKKYGWTPEWDETAGHAVEEINHEFDPTINLNLFVSFKDLFIKKLEIGAGVYNILNEDMYFVQPYNGAHAALPDASTSYRIKLSYNLF